MVPALTQAGLLPPGVHVASWTEVSATFGTTAHRKLVLAGLHRAARRLAAAGCKRIWLDGSFTTIKSKPGDWDGCWDPTGVDFEKLDPIFLDFTQEGRIRMQMMYMADLFPSSFLERGSQLLFVSFFQVDKATGAAKGIIELPLTGALP